MNKDEIERNLRERAKLFFKDSSDENMDSLMEILDYAYDNDFSLSDICFIVELGCQMAKEEMNFENEKEIKREKIKNKLKERAKQFFKECDEESLNKLSKVIKEAYNNGFSYGDVRFIIDLGYQMNKDDETENWRR